MWFGINKFHNLVCLVLGSSMFSYKQNGIDTVKKKPSVEGKKQRASRETWLSQLRIDNLSLTKVSFWGRKKTQMMKEAVI